MKLTIISMDHADFGAYKCVAKNSLGETDGSIKLYSKYKNPSLKHIFLVNVNFMGNLVERLEIYAVIFGIFHKV